MSERTLAARQAVLKAWKREQELVNEGKGTYAWTPEQQQSIHDIGIAYDEDGYAFHGHHMQSVELFPQYQGDPENIQFLSKADHIKAHNGWYGNLTNWYYNPATGEKVEFHDNKYKPCEIILLKNPVFPLPNLVSEKPYTTTEHKNESVDTVSVADNRTHENASLVRSTMSTRTRLAGEAHIATPTRSDFLYTIKKGLHGIGRKIQSFWDRNGESIKYYAKAAGRFALEHAPEIISVVATISSSSSDDDEDDSINYGSKSNKSERNHEASNDMSIRKSDDSPVDDEDTSDDDVEEGAGTGTPKSPHPRIGYEGLRRKKNADGELEWVKVPVKPTYIHPDQTEMDEDED